MINWLVEMDKDIRTGFLLGCFFVAAFFIIFFFNPWLIFSPFIFIFLLIYTTIKAEKLEKKRNGE